MYLNTIHYYDRGDEIQKYKRQQAIIADDEDGGRRRRCRKSCPAPLGRRDNAIASPAQWLPLASAAMMAAVMTAAVG